MRLRYTLPAIADITSILDDLTDRPSKGAKRVHARIRVVTDLLLQSPLSGSATEDPTIRRMRRRHANVSFSMRWLTTTVIHAVRHGARVPYDNPGSTWDLLHETW